MIEQDRTPSPQDAWHSPNTEDFVLEAKNILSDDVCTNYEESIFYTISQDLFEGDVSNCHPQLRGTVCAHGENGVVFASQQKIKLYNFVTRKVEDIACTGWPVISLGIFKNYVAAGGHFSNLLVYDLNKRCTLFDGKIEGDMNNSFAFHCVDDCVRLIIANNSPKHGIQVYSLPSLQKLEVIPCPNYRERTAIGCVSVSPNGNWMVAVGDNKQAFLFHIKQGKYPIPKQIKLPGICFQVAWAPNSKLFAVACDAGFCVVLDTEGQVIVAHPAVGYSKEHFNYTMHAVRSVAFSKNLNPPLLAFAQPQKYISVVTYKSNYDDDTSMFVPQRQNIKPCLEEKRFQSITGIDFTINGNLLAGYEWQHPPEIFFLSPPGGREAMVMRAEENKQGCVVLFQPKQAPTLKKLCTEFIRNNFVSLLKNSSLAQFKKLPNDVQTDLFDDIDDFLMMRGIGIKSN